MSRVPTFSQDHICLFQESRDEMEGLFPKPSLCQTAIKALEQRPATQKVYQVHAVSNVKARLSHVKFGLGLFPSQPLSIICRFRGGKKERRKTKVHFQGKTDFPRLQMDLWLARSGRYMTELSVRALMLAQRRGVLLGGFAEMSEQKVEDLELLAYCKEKA